MARLDADLVRSLAELRTQRWAITCYLGLDATVVPTPSALSSHVTSIVDRAERALDEVAPESEHEALAELRSDVHRVGGFLRDELDRSGAGGVALFAAGADGIWQDVLLPGPVDDAVHIGHSFVLAPLLRFLERRANVVTAAVGRDRGSVWVLGDGHSVEAQDLSRDGQGQHDQGGWSQARYARSRDREALDHMRAVADAVAELAPEGSGTRVAVACLREQRPAFEELLEPHVRSSLIGWLDFEAHEDLDDLRPDVEQLLGRALERERLALIARWEEERGQHSGRATDTWVETITAAWDGRVETLLVDGRTTTAHDCPACGRGYPEPGACLLDGAALEEATGGARELAIRGTLVHGGEVRVLGAQLPGAEVAALLRYPQPAR